MRDEVVARPSPFVRHHINVLGGHSFQLPGLPPLCDKPPTPGDWASRLSSAT
ncbi:hypothetical protein AB0L74_34580 [Streptomyces sp. NPDC052020]|uniref:hypothetical protein n=1 Tax=Streptomyces sp. NPDC052020 TaxID=3155677 RepID=UPI00342EA2EB